MNNVDEYIAEFVWRHPEFEERLGPRHQDQAPAMLKIIRDEGEFNMLHPDVPKILMAAFSFKKHEANDLVQSWFRQAA